MSKTVFILGAGASFSSGVPLMNDFWEKGWQLWKTNQIDSRYDLHFERVESALVSLQRTHSKANLNYNNLESLVTAIDMAGLIEKLPGIEPENIKDLKEAVAQVIIATIEATSIFQVEKGSTTPKPHPSYNEFVELIKLLKKNANPKHDISVITFNYDIGLDYGLHHNNMGPDYCLDEDEEEEKATNQVKVLKLHGSINWMLDKEKQKVVERDFTTFFENRNFGYGRKHGEKCKLDLSNSIRDAGGQYRSYGFIAPPSWYKGEYHLNLKPVWKQAANDLEQAENIFVIGFSLPDTDLFFKNLYALGVTGDARLQRIWVYDPNGELEDKYEEFLGPTAKHKYNFNREPKKEPSGKSELKEGTFEYAIYSIGTHFGIESRLPGNDFWVF